MRGSVDEGRIRRTGRMGERIRRSGRIVEVLVHRKG
jgi:hypothetical protein